MVDNNILIYSTLNKSKSLMAERFVKTIKAKIHKKMTATSSKSYIPYLNKYVEQYNKTYHHSVN